MATKTEPHATSTTATRSTRLLTAAVTPMTTQGRQEGDQRLGHHERTAGRVCGAPGRTARIWSTPIRPSRKARAPPTR